MRKTNFTTGYSMVEVLVAVAVLLIAIVGPMTIASQGIKSSSFALEQNSAFFLAQEGIEAIHFFKGLYAVRDLTEDQPNPLEPDNDISWDWIQGVLVGPGPCPSTLGNTNGTTCSFGIDWRDRSLANNMSSDQCTGANVSQCDLYLDESDSRAVYSHVPAGGTLSPFNRIITVERKTGYAVEVTSVVSWDSAVFPGQPQEVTLRTMMYDSNYEQ